LLSNPGAFSHNFSSGSHAEGRTTARGAIAYILDNNIGPKRSDATIEAMKQAMKKVSIVNLDVQCDLLKG
jgi:hypothetical protein